MTARRFDSTYPMHLSPSLTPNSPNCTLSPPSFHLLTSTDSRVARVVLRGVLLNLACRGLHQVNTLSPGNTLLVSAHVGILCLQHHTPRPGPPSPLFLFNFQAVFLTGNDSGVAGVILRDVLLDLANQVSAHISGLCVDAATNTAKQGDGGTAQAIAGDGLKQAHPVIFVKLGFMSRVEG